MAVASAMLDLSTKLNSVETESDKGLELLSKAQNAHNRVGELVQSVIG